MTTLTLTPPGLPRSADGEARRPGARDEVRSAPSLFDAGGEPTLDELIAGVWEGLATHRAVRCPVCGDELAPEDGVHASPIGGRCRGCQSTLG